MTSDDRTITTAITSYAVMLNRSQWLDETRIGLQLAVWKRLIARQPSRGVITVEHFETAIQALANDMRPIDVLPSHVVRRAATLAADDNELVGRCYAAWENGDDMLLDEFTLLLNGPAEYGPDEFRADVGRIKAKVGGSVLAEDTVTQMLAALDHERDQAIAWHKSKIAERALQPMLPPEATPDDVIAEWFTAE